MFEECFVSFYWCYPTSFNSTEFVFKQYKTLILTLQSQKQQKLYEDTHHESLNQGHPQTRGSDLQWNEENTVFYHFTLLIFMYLGCDQEKTVNTWNISRMFIVLCMANHRTGSRSGHTNWPQNHKLIDVVACSLVFSRLIGFLFI